MPLYEYECTACRKRTEKIQKFSDPEITACPKCGGQLERVISAPAISFKGGGWFADGYGNAKPVASGSGEGSSIDPAKTESKTSVDSSSDSAKSESKPSSDTSSAAASSAPAATPTATTAPTALSASSKT